MKVCVGILTSIFICPGTPHVSEGSATVGMVEISGAALQKQTHIRTRLLVCLKHRDIFQSGIYY